MRKKTISVTLSLLVIGALFLFSAGLTPKTPKQVAPQRPNIIFIISDDHTQQAIGAYGNRLAKTPNIDRLAREGAILYNNVVANSICGPSRATLLTGKYSHQNGFKTNNGGVIFDVNQPVFTENLQQNGYQTAWIGKMHLGTLPHGFDYLNVLPGQGEYYNPDFIDAQNKTTRHPGYVSDIVTQLSTDWLGQRDPSRPFVLVMGHKATHRVWQPALEDMGAYDDLTFPLPPTFYDDYVGRKAAKDQDMTIDKTMRLKEDLKVHMDYESMKRLSPEQKAAMYDYYEKKVSREFDEKKPTGKALVEWKYQRYMRDYLSTANSLDRNIGKLLDYLDKTGLAKNTVVIYTSDQGFYLGEHGWFDKRFIYEESLKTPFIVRYPGVIKPGMKINGLVSNVDWAPTILNLTGTAVPDYMVGKSFLPLLTGQKSAIRDRAYYHYYEYPVDHHVYPHFGLRTPRYTLVRFYGPANFWELYDIQKDPHNLTNVYGKKGHEKITADLKKQLKGEIETYKDDEALALFEQPAN